MAHSSLESRLCFNAFLHSRARFYFEAGFDSHACVCVCVRPCIWTSAPIYLLYKSVAFIVVILIRLKWVTLNNIRSSFSFYFQTSVLAPPIPSHEPLTHPQEHIYWNLRSARLYAQVYSRSRTVYVCCMLYVYINKKRNLDAMCLL